MTRQVTASTATLVLAGALAVAVVAIAVLVTLVLAGDDGPPVAALSAHGAQPTGTQAAVTPTASPTSEPTATPTPTPTVEPTATPTPEPTATPVPPRAAPPVVQVATATIAPAAECVDAQRYLLDRQYLSTLQELLIGRGLLDSSMVGHYFPPGGTTTPCYSPCDRQWLDTAIVAAERIRSTGVAPTSFAPLPANLCKG